MLHQVAFRLAGGQIAITGIIAAIAWWLGGSVAAFSAAVGGAIGITAGLYQALRMFRVDAGIEPERFLSGVYVSEAVKILLTVALFIAAIRVLRVEMLATMVGYIGTYLMYWIALGTKFPWLTNKG